MRQEAKEYPSFPLGNRLYIRLGLYSRGKTFHASSEKEGSGQGQGHMSVALCLPESPMSALTVSAVILIVP